MDPGPAYKRRRPAVACTECRRRKVRCDGHSPCGSCKKSRISSRCLYNNRQSKTRVAENDLDLGMQNQQCDSIVALEPCLPHKNTHGQSVLDSQLFSEPQDLNLFNANGVSLSDHISFELAEDGSLQMSDSFHSEQASTGLDSPPLQSLSDSPLWTTSSLPTIVASSVTSSVQSPPQAQIKSLWSSALQPQPQIYAHLQQHEDQWFQAFSKCDKLAFLTENLSKEGLRLSPDQEIIRPLLATYKRLSRRISKAYDSRSHGWGWISNQGTARSLLPPRTNCNVLVDAYIKTFESVLRIIYVPSFLRDYEHFWEDDSLLSPDESFACKLLLIAALGSITLVPTESQEEPASSCRDQSSNWIAYVQHWLARRTITEMREDLAMAQIASLLTLARHIHYQNPAPIGVACLSEGHGLVHMAVQMSLHREPTVLSPNISLEEAEIRRRLWATMLEISLQVSVVHGLSAPIAPESFDCNAPSSFADDDLVLGGGPLSVAHPSALMLLSQTQKLRLRVLYLANAPNSLRSYKDYHCLAAELNAAYSASLKKLHSPLTSFQAHMLAIFTKPFILSLHSPFAEQPYDRLEYYYSRRMCMEICSQLLISTTDQGPYAILLSHGHGHLLSQQRQATVSLCLGLIREYEEGTFPNLDSTSLLNLQNILSNSVALFKRRVEVSGGAYSTDEFLFFSSALSYIENMQKKAEPDRYNEYILETVKTVLSFCCYLMEQQSHKQSISEARTLEAISDLGI